MVRRTREMSTISRKWTATAVSSLCLLCFCYWGSAAVAQVRPRVVNGSETVSGAYPWMTALVYTGMPAEDGHFCGGMLIAPDTVLTAAHCVDIFTNPELRTAAGVVIGRTDLASQGGISMPVRGAMIHPLYDPYLFSYDFALLRLAAPVDIAPVQLPSAAELGTLPVGQLLTVLGWGTTDPVYPILPTVLQEAQVPLVSDEECFRSLGRLFIARSMMCAGTRASSKDVTDQVDAAQGDSGGPLLAHLGGVRKVVGVVSWGFTGRADRFPGVYARVGAALDWIASRPPLPPEAALVCNTEWDGGKSCTLDSPAISGAPVVGSTLTCNRGQWGGEEVVFEYLWGRTSPSDNQTTLVQASAEPVYTVQSTDAGATLTCVVVGRNSAAAVRRSSSPSGTVSSEEGGIDGGQPLPAAPTPTSSAPQPGPDTVAPKTRFIGVRCEKKVCRVHVVAEDGGVVEGPASGVAAVEAELTTGRERAKSGVKRTLPSRVRTLQATRLSGEVWVFSLPRREVLKGAIHLSIRAIDQSGNRQSRPTKVRVRG
jgi:hypothetical protein